MLILTTMVDLISAAPLVHLCDLVLDVSDANRNLTTNLGLQYQGTKCLVNELLETMLWGRLTLTSFCRLYSSLSSSPSLGRRLGSAPSTISMEYSLDVIRSRCCRWCVCRSAGRRAACGFDLICWSE